MKEGKKQHIRHKEREHGKKEQREVVDQGDI
jgi:hypothetical protein